MALHACMTWETRSHQGKVKVSLSLKYAQCICFWRWSIQRWKQLYYFFTIFYNIYLIVTFFTLPFFILHLFYILIIIFICIYIIKIKWLLLKTPIFLRMIRQQRVIKVDHMLEFETTSNKLEFAYNIILEISIE